MSLACTMVKSMFAVAQYMAHALTSKTVQDMIQQPTLGSHSQVHEKIITGTLVQT